MTEITLPNVPVPLSGLVLGTMTFGDAVDAPTAAAMVDAALDAGITGIDTANVHAGSEEMLADLLRSRRDRVVLATKAGMKPHPDVRGHAALSPRSLRASVDGSLRRLGTDRIDLFYLHQPDRTTPVADTLATVADLVGEGKILALGVSNFAAWRIVELTNTAAAVGAPPPVMAQQLYNLLARRVEEEYLEYSRTRGLPTMAYSPLAGGLLTGRQPGASPLTGARARYWRPGLSRSVERIAGIARGAGIGVVELSLRWLLTQPVSAIVLGASSVEQLRANVAAAAKGPLPRDVWEACGDVGLELRGPMPIYHR